MYLHRGPFSGRKLPIGPLLLLTLAIVAIDLSMAGEAQAVDRWTQSRQRAGAGQFGAFQRGPSASGPSASGPSSFGPNAAGSNAPALGAVEPNARAGAIAAPDQHGEAVGGVPADGQLPSERRGAEFQRQYFNPAGRGAADFQRRAPGSLARNSGQRMPGAGGFARQALAGRGAGGFGRPLAGRFQAGRFGPGPMAGLIARRPMIGERGFTGVPPAGESRFLTNEMVFHVPANVSPQVVDNVARRYGLNTIGSQSFNLSGGTLFRFRITDGRPVADVIRALEAENIGVAQPNYVFRLQQDTALAARGTPGASSQYIVDKLRLVDVHRMAIGSNVLVAVIDSEIDAKHPELAGAVVDEFDAIGNHDKPHLHGTGMAGAIAAHRKLVGIAPGVRLLAVHAFSSNTTDSAQATSAHILMGIDWAIRKGAKVINMSFAGPDDPMLQLALQKAHDKGVVLIGAAGNMGPKSPPLYPAADPNVIAVTATDAKDQLLAQANRGPYVAVAAPGVDILEPAPNGGYQLTTGTSVAAAHVSGIVALLLDRDPTLDVAAIRDILTSSAKHPGAKANPGAKGDLVSNGRDDQFGWGLVDPYRALTELDARMARDRSKNPPPAPTAANPQPVSAR
jgi:Subtilase family